MAAGLGTGAALAARLHLTRARAAAANDIPATGASSLKDGGAAIALVGLLVAGWLSTPSPRRHAGPARRVVGATGVQ